MGNSRKSEYCEELGCGGNFYYKSLEEDHPLILHNLELKEWYKRQNNHETSQFEHPRITTAASEFRASQKKVIMSKGRQDNKFTADEIDDVLRNSGIVKSLDMLQNVAAVRQQAGLYGDYGHEFESQSSSSDYSAPSRVSKEPSAPQKSARRRLQALIERFER